MSCALKQFLLIVSPKFAALTPRVVAQPGSALVWGARGRWFESSPPDESPDVNQDFIFCWNCVLSNFEVCGM